MFYDTEDGDVKHLKLSMLNTDPALLSWVEFDAEKQTLLALYVIKKLIFCSFFENVLLFIDHWKIMYQNGK